MEKYKAQTKFIQYQLWYDCRNGCKFCFAKHQPSMNKLNSLNFILDKLDDNEVLKYEEVGFIGGEIFDNQLEDENVRETFYKIFEKISKMHFSKIYIATSLIFDMNNYLIPFLNYLKELNILNKVLLCTSYELKYRFNVEGKKELWENNMLELHKLYPELRTHVEMILAQFFIDAVNDNKFSISEFCDKFYTRIDYIEPSSGMYYVDKEDCTKDIPDFFPTKSSFIQFLKKTVVENKEINLKDFLSMELRSEKLYYFDSGIRLTADNRRKTDGRCKLVDKTKKYEIGFIDSEDTMVNVAREFYSIIYGD